MTPRRRSQQGYALLLVYAMAAMAAVMLYMQLPRVAFEAQRDKEQLLIDRGEQYSRAVQLFVRKNNRFPPDMDALENTQQIRFLRRKYKDPLTGKDDWRLIHVGPGGVFTDSLVYGPKKKKGPENGPQTFIAEMQQIGGNVSTGETGVNQATRRRPSDQPGAPGSLGSADAGAQPFPGGAAPINGPVMVLADGRIVPANVTGQAPPPVQNTLAQPGLPGQNTAGQNPFPQGRPEPPPFSPQPGVAQYGQPGQAGPNALPPGFQNQPNVAGGPPGAAANIINQILTTPRPGGLNGLGNTNNTGTPVGQSPAGQTIGGGFAGVASKAEQEGIKTYKERTAYNEWEFVYDMSSDPARAVGVPGVGTAPGAAQNPGSGGIPQIPGAITGK